MQIFAFRDEGDLKIVKDAFFYYHEGWALMEHNRDKYPGYPASAVTLLDRTTNTLNLHYLDPREVVRVAAVLEN